MPSVFDFESYKPYLNAWIQCQPHQGHGSRAVIARAVGCQTAYISQILRGSAHLSPEQSEKIAQLFGLSEEETSYFLLLVQKDRAGTASLRNHSLRQIRNIQGQRQQLKNRLVSEMGLNLEAQATYFSSWIYSAIHVLVTIPEYQQRERISEYLQLPRNVVDGVLKFLINCRLITESSGGLRPGTSRMHLPHDSPLIARHHINWRLRAVRDLEVRREESLHYSSCVSISRKDAAEIREQLLKTIEAMKSRVKESPEESLHSICLDFFEI